MKSASLSMLDPTLIDGIRDKLADEFAQRVYTVIPDISECIEFETEACKSPADKQRYERASQLLVSCRRDLQSQIAASMRRIFDESLCRLLDSTSSAMAVSLANMTLVADDRLDEEIAINHCARRLKEQCEYELWGLTKRLIALAGVGHPADAQNPISPRSFAQALMEAIDSLRTDGAVRLAIFKTFSPALLEIVPAVYTTANHALAARGIEIEGGDYYGRPVLTPEHPFSHEPANDALAFDAAEVNLVLTSALTRILSQSADSTSPAEAATEAAADRKDPAAPADALLRTSVLPAFRQTEPAALNALRGDLQHLMVKSGHRAAGQEESGRTLHDARHLLQEKLTRDENAIGDIVTVAFDKLLADARMPRRLRAVVARLQIPVLQQALHDRSLLTQVDHPVRKLLDLIAEFGLLLALDQDGYSTLASVESIVDGLVRISDSEPDAFRLAFAQLDNLFYHHEEAALMSDQQLRELERRETLTFVAAEVDREIGVRLQNIALPPAINSFIHVTWREVLIHARVNGSSEADQWKLALSTLDNIVKLLSPSTDVTERHRLARILPDFVDLLLNSLDDGDRHDVFAANFLAELNRIEKLAIAGRWDEVGGERVRLEPTSLMALDDLASPSAQLASMNLACGDWIETRDFAGTRRWRLNWITTIYGTCVFKHYESGSTRFMNCAELRERLTSGEVHRVHGLGLAEEMFHAAFETVSRKLRREATMAALSVPTGANRSVSAMQAPRQWGAPPPVPAARRTAYSDQKML